LGDNFFHVFGCKKRILGQQENAARRALVAAEESGYRRRVALESELHRSQSLTSDLAHVRSLLEEEQERTRVLKRTVGEMDVHKKKKKKVCVFLTFEW
jgi:hypothetical protein